MHTKVAAVLEGKGALVWTVRSYDQISQALSILHEGKVGALVVADDGVHIDGILSERDIVREMHQVGREIFEVNVASIMSTQVQTCSPDDEVGDLALLMTERRIRHIPVVEDGVLCGIISIGDVVKHRIAQLEGDRDELLEYVGAR
jgi:CBS domain-containing protein